MNKAAVVVIACCWLLIPRAGFSSDWPQWRGPTRNGISTEVGWSYRWPAGGPRKLWTVKVGEGWSNVSVVAGKVYTCGNVNGQDVVSCLRADNGGVVWKYSYRCASGDYGGPRATPTVDGANVYTLSRDGRALCLNAATGRPVWQADLVHLTNAEVPNWGFAGSPLIQGDLVLYNVGKAGVALNKLTGKMVWTSGTNPAGYASPTPYSTGKQNGVAFFVAWGIVALNPKNGAAQWQHPWNTNFDVNAADPVFSGNMVFISSNYNRGCALLKINGNTAAKVWENRTMRNHFNSCVLLNGALFGNDENTLKCLEFATGNERWKSRGIGKGGMIAADGKLIVLSERGELIVANAASDKYTELARAKVLDGTCWTHPVLANGAIYCRSHEGDLVCLDVKGK